MCWNAPVSLLTFLTSVLMCFYLWYRNNSNDRALSIFIFWFALMQLFEFFMWRNMQDHSLVSKLSLVSIQLQPFVLVASLYYFSLYNNNNKNNNKYTNTEKLVLGVIGFASLVKTLAATHYSFITQAANNWLSTKGPHCHLMWWFNRHFYQVPWLARSDPLYAILLLLGVIMIKPFKQGLIYFIFAFISAIVSRLFYPKEEGSLWCWIANLMGVIAIAMPYAMPYAIPHLKI